MRTPSPGRLVRDRTLDVAKGAAMLSVVVYHSLLFAEALEIYSLPWAMAVGALRLVPLPVFLVVAGLVARRTLADRGLLRRRLRQLAVVYLVATVGYVGLFSLVDFPRASETGFGSLGGLLRELVLPEGYLWFLHALLLALVVTALTRRLPAAVALGGTLLVSTAFSSGWVGTPSDRVDEAFAYLPAFVLGARYPALVTALTGSATTRGLRSARLGLAVGFVALTVANGLLLVLGPLGHLSDLERLPGLGVVMLALSAGAGLVAARGLRLGPLGRPLAWLGRSTLVVYLLHEVVLALVVVLARPVLLAVPQPWHPLVGPALAVVGVLLPLGVLAVVRATRSRPPQARPGPSPATSSSRAR
ncbi:acyltransferase family protein [Pseudokineococcus sp. 1T1Z-3]|uniref:acyltransferase family protein n=1 Tax=Pseudokineococcus sp. 1T1Z-3 TaxID=3132745 RepID=UPI0030AFA623